MTGLARKTLNLSISGVEENKCAFNVISMVCFQSSLDRKLLPPSIPQNVYDAQQSGAIGPYTPQLAVADSLHSLPRNDLMDPVVRAGIHQKSQPSPSTKEHPVEKTQAKEGQAYLSPAAPPNRRKLHPDDKRADHFTPEPEVKYFAPAPDYEKAPPKASKKSKSWRKDRKQPGYSPLELSIISESTESGHVKRVGSIDKMSKKDQVKESAFVGAAAATGAAATNIAVTSAGFMASQAAASAGCCAALCAKCVVMQYASVVMFVGVVATVGYAGYNGGEKLDNSSQCVADDPLLMIHYLLSLQS